MNALIVVRTVADLRRAVGDFRKAGRTVGLIPTMGALHAGHVSLVQGALDRGDVPVASIFVNPTQFGPNEDFAAYPRGETDDFARLEVAGCRIAFAPGVDEMYPGPGPQLTTVTVGGSITEGLCGPFRPGHFQGVATVVLKLFEIAQPRFAYFGRKDAQQARILRQMARDLDLDTQLVVRPIVREPDGLALSSRNAYLQEGSRRAATALYRSLEAVRDEIAAGERDPARLLGKLRSVLQAEPGVAIDYAEIVDAETLEPVVNLRGKCLVLLAAVVGKTRLIDNALIEQENGGFKVSL